MGELNVKPVKTKKELSDFTKHLLRDVRALDRMLHEDWFNVDPLHIGAEQEICLVDKNYKPANKNLELLAKLPDSFTTELAKFNIEANLNPVPFSGDCFNKLEENLNGLLVELEKACNELGITYVLTGILPTIRIFDLELENLTPLDRYRALVAAISKLRGKVYELRIGGIDELNIKHDSAMLEACNTSFQVHLQVKPDEFVRKYNMAQVLAAPVLAIASNSPLLFGRRLWHETRVALFQQSIDTRITSEHLRDRSPRVTFGNSWLRHSILDLFKEDIVRFRVMLMAQVDSDVLGEMDDGITPKLSALMIHNSTVYRWNRPCYGISPNGKPHLRIENRLFPAGPSVVDEIANAAFWLGLMNAFDDEHTDVTKFLEFDEAKSNFILASRNGLDTELCWYKGKKIGTSELIKKELLPIARQGLAKNKVRQADIDKFLGVIEERNRTRRNGTSWILNSYSQLVKKTTREEAAVTLTAAMVNNSKRQLPVHEWKLAEVASLKKWEPTSMLVEEFMTTDLFTAQQEDIPELVADIMDWQKIRFTPIEDDKGNLIGLISARILLRHFSHKSKPSITVKDLMIIDPLTIEPQATIDEAMKLMRENKIGCLPVVKNQKLVGIITEENFLSVTSRLLDNLK